MGLETENCYIDQLMEYTERPTLAELAKLPKGEYRAESCVGSDDFSDQPVYLKTRILIDEEGIFFDLGGRAKSPTRRMVGMILLQRSSIHRGVNYDAGMLCAGSMSLTPRFHP